MKRSVNRARRSEIAYQGSLLVVPSSSVPSLYTRDMQQFHTSIFNDCFKSSFIMLVRVYCNIWRLLNTDRFYILQLNLKDDTR